MTHRPCQALENDYTLRDKYPFSSKQWKKKAYEVSFSKHPNLFISLIIYSSFLLGLFLSKTDSDRVTNNQIIKYAHKPCLVHHRKLIFILNSPVAVACVFSIFFPRWYFPTIRRVIFGFLSEMTAKINNGNDSMIRHLFEWEDRE